MSIARIVADRYVIQLPEVVSDSTHGDQPSFELITVRLTDSDGGEGVGYTYTGGFGGRAILSLLRDELVPLLAGKDETDIEGLRLAGPASTRTWPGSRQCGNTSVPTFP